MKTFGFAISIALLFVTVALATLVLDSHIHPSYDRIMNETVYVGLYDDMGRELGHGSGVLTDAGIFTAAHVILTGEDGDHAKPQKNILVRFSDGRFVRAEIVTYEYDLVRGLGLAKHDFALLRIPKRVADQYPKATFSCSSDPDVGDRLYVSGSPLGLRWIVTQGRALTTYRQKRGLSSFGITDAIVAGGVSGGPVFDRFGRVVGLIEGYMLNRLSGGFSPSISNAGYTIYTRMSLICSEVMIHHSSVS